MGDPDDGGEAEGETGFATNVVVVERTEPPMSVSEGNGSAH